jgi:ribonuclease Z
MEPHLLEDCKKWKIPRTDWIIQGFSQAANKTGFAIFSLRLLFDAGIPTQKTPQIVLLTHSHSDHSFNIPCVAMGHKKQCPIYCPHEMEEPLKLLCRASQSLNDCVSLIEQDQVSTIGVTPGETILYKNIKINVVKCCHSVPTVGFELVETKNILKPEFVGLSSSFLKQQKSQGVDITEKKDVSKFTFLGDTTIDVFQDRSILESPVIMIECTILDQEVSPDETYRRGHIHWEQLKPVIESSPDTLFVIIHISKRYTSDYLDKFFKDGPENIYVW